MVGSRRAVVVWVVLVVGLVVWNRPAQASAILPGFDLFQTVAGDPTGGGTSVFINEPIPADFFNPGSLPFEGTVYFQGGSSTGVDTIVQRLNPISPLGGDPIVIPIEIVALNLVSCEPITVHYGPDYPDGSTAQWSVKLDLSPIVTPPPGTMVVQPIPGSNGGTFTSEFFVQPRFTFTRIDDPSQVRVLEPTDPLDLHLPSGWWSHSPPPGLLFPPPPGSFFYPGSDPFIPYLYTLSYSTGSLAPAAPGAGPDIELNLALRLVGVTAVPLPSAACSGGVMLVGLALWRRRRVM